MAELLITGLITVEHHFGRTGGYLEGNPAGGCSRQGALWLNEADMVLLVLYINYS